MAKKQSNKFLSGAVVGAVLGVVSGILLAPQAGKKTRDEISEKSGQFYKYIAPTVKKMGKMGKKEYENIVEDMAKIYGKARKMSAPEVKGLVNSAKKHWSDLSSHF